MKRMYESNITNKQWYVYDILGNIGWITYIVCLILSFSKIDNNKLINILLIIPAVFMLIGIIELITERIKKLDRILPLYRLLLGFGALTLGGLLGFIISLIFVVIDYHLLYLLMMLGGLFCFVFAYLLFIKYKKQYEEIHDDQISLHGAYYPKNNSTSAIIIMLGDSYKDRLGRTGAKYLNQLGLNVLALGTCKDSDYSHVKVPIERFGASIEFLKAKGNKKFGIAGASTTAMDSLLASSYYEDITLTLAMSPCDFVMEGFIRDGLDKAKERPSDSSSSSFNGQELPHLPYAYRHPDYWKMVMEEAKEGKDLIASRKMFDESERLHPLQKEELIKVENIKGKIVFIGAKDDVLWDTVKYIQRMNERIKEYQTNIEVNNFIYEYGTHFVFPETMLKMMIPLFGDALARVFKSGRVHSKECKKTRIDIDNNIQKIISEWIKK